MKLLFGVLLVLSVGLFALMQWGGALSGATKNGQPMPDLNPEKIKLLAMPAAKQLAGSAVQQPVPLASAATGSATAPVVVAEPVAASAPEPAVVPLAPPAPPAPAHATLKPATACLEWGEFSGNDLQLATQELASMKLGNHLSQRMVEYESGYWVYIPPLKNHAAVNKKIAQLKSLGVDEYFVVQNSRKWTNAISLGVYKTQDAAQNFLVSIRKKGVRGAKLGERKSKLKFTVFMINHPDAAAVSHLGKLQKDFPNSELNPVPCN